LILFHTLFGGIVVFELCKGKAVFGVTITLAYDVVDLTVLLEHLSELPLDLDDISLSGQ
jgi:hypothetical protein